jgi:hypothetical protein
MSSMLFEELLPVLSLDEYEDDLPEKYRGICKLVKIRTVGWRNTNFVGVIGIILVVLFMWITSRNLEDGAGEERLITIWLWKSFLGDICFAIGIGIGTALSWVGSAVMFGWKDVVLPLWGFLKLLIFKSAWQVFTSCL